MANTSKSRSNITKAFCGLPLLMLIWSCNQTPAKKQPEQEAATPAATGTKDSTTLHPQQSDIRPGQKLVTGQVYIDTIIFREYDDNGDYYILSGQKNGNETGFIYDWDQNSYPFNRGDLIKISWKIDSIRMAGDDEALVFTERALSAERIREGNVSAFRKRYKKDLRYHYTSETYTQTALDQIYRLLEYYIANSDNKLLEATLNSGQAALSYSIEQRKENDKEYTVVGLANTSKHRSSIIQWLYISFEEKTKLYEYDIATEQLKRFD